jgi:hypothetical protein
LRRQLGGFIGSKVKRNQYRKAEPDDGRKSSRKKTQSGEEGRRVFSESFEENPKEEDPIPGYPFCIRSISPVALGLCLPGRFQANVSVFILGLNSLVEHAPLVFIHRTPGTFFIRFMALV